MFYHQAKHYEPHLDDTVLKKDSGKENKIQMKREQKAGNKGEKYYEKAMSRTVRRIISLTAFLMRNKNLLHLMMSVGEAVLKAQ